MSKLSKSYSLLIVGKTQESTETQEFERYIGLGSSYVLAVNPNKAELEKIFGREVANEPEYVVDTENGKEARIHFIVRTDPEQCNGIEITNRLMFTLQNSPAYTEDKSLVQVIDEFGNSTLATTEDTKTGKKILSKEGKEKKLGPKYRMACRGEADLVAFLKKYLGVKDAFNYIDGAWILKEKVDDFYFGLEHISDYFKGDFSELREALKMQPNNKVKLLYGVRTSTDSNGNKREYQAIASRGDLILANNAGSNAIAKVEKELARIKSNGGYPSTEFKVQELAKYEVEPTNLDTPAESTSEMPWD